MGATFTASLAESVVGSRMSAKAGMCAICNDQPKRYKCPICLTPYCSASCFAGHKQSCIKPAAASAPAPTRDQQIDTLLADAKDLGVHVPIDRLQRISTNASLVQAVRDPKLQRVLLAIDGSQDPAKVLQHAKDTEGPRFAQFLDELLVTMGAAERCEGGGVQFVGLPLNHGPSTHNTAHGHNEVDRTSQRQSKELGGDIQGAGPDAGTGGLSVAGLS